MNIFWISAGILLTGVVVAGMIILGKLTSSSRESTTSTTNSGDSGNDSNTSNTTTSSPSSSNWWGLAIAAVMLAAVAGGLLWWSPWKDANNPVARAEAQRQELLAAGWREATVIVQYPAVADGRKLTVLAVKFPADITGKSIVFQNFRFTRLFRLGKNGIYIPLEAEHPPVSGYVPGKPEQGGCWGIFQSETAGKIPVRIFWRPR